MNSFRARVLSGTLGALLATLSVTAAAQPPTPPATPPAVTQTARVSDDVYRTARPATFRIDTIDDTGDGVGTGYFISDTGLALTAYHVVLGARELTVRMLQGQRYPARVIGYDDMHDVALLQVDVKGRIPFLPLAALDPSVGEAALAIGNGGGGFLQPKHGTLQRLGVIADRADFPSGTLQLTAKVVPGDSGGPVLNARGEAIGVISYIQLDREGNHTSYAVPMKQSSALLAALRAGVKNDAPVIGISLSNQAGMVFDNLRDEAFELLGLGRKPGVVFDFVMPGGPAEAAGLRALEVIKPATDGNPPVFRADVILAVDGRPVRGFFDLMAVVRARKVGDTVKLTIQRGDREVAVDVQLAGRAKVYTDTGE